jgi:hypothetical protein
MRGLSVVVLQGVRTRAGRGGPCPSSTPRSRTFAVSTSSLGTSIHPDAVTLLEGNTLPGFTGTSLYPEAAGVLGLTLPTLCDLLVRSARRRGPTPRNAGKPLPK